MENCKEFPLLSKAVNYPLHREGLWTRTEAMVACVKTCGMVREECAKRAVELMKDQK